MSFQHETFERIIDWRNNRFDKLMYIVGPVDVTQRELKVFPMSTGMGGIQVAYQLLRPIAGRFNLKYGGKRVCRSMHDLRGRDVFIYVGVKR